MSKKFYIISLLVILVLAGYIVFISVNSSKTVTQDNSVLLGDSRGCCMDPPCQECFQEKAACDCQQREERGLETCGECEEAESCEEQVDVCTVDLEDNY